MRIGEAHAGNDGAFYLGNDAALLAGAATASAQGASATWYNPARVAVGNADDFDLSGSAYLLRFGGTPDLEAAPGYRATRQRLAALDLTAVPTAVAVRRKLLGLDIGAGLFVPTRAVVYARTLVRAEPADGSAPSEVAIDGNSTFTEYYGGLAVGRALTSRLRVGGAVFGYYSSRIETTIIGARRVGAGFITSSGTVAGQRIGAQLVTGLSWRAAPSVELGFTLRSPVLQLASQVQATNISSSQIGSAADASLVFDERALGADTLLLVPLRAEVGTAIDLDGRTTVAADLRLRGRLANERAETSVVPVADVRAGLRRQVGTNLWLGAGAFTDRSGQPRGSGTSTILDFYGGTIGVELGKPYRVLADGDEKPRTLRFSTAVAISYAVGVGSVGNLAVAPRGALFELQPQRDDVTAHEFMFHVGSSVGTFAGP